MAVVTGDAFGNGVAAVVIAKCSGSFDAQVVAERHLYPERYPVIAADDAALADANLLPEESSDAFPQPTGSHPDKGLTGIRHRQTPPWRGSFFNVGATIARCPRNPGRRV